MLQEETALRAPGEVAAAIERAIIQQTGGCLRQLRVEATADRVMVHAWVPSYYLQQRIALAVQGMPTLIPVQLNLEVRARNARAPEGRHGPEERSLALPASLKANASIASFSGVIHAAESAGTLPAGGPG